MIEKCIPGIYYIYIKKKLKKIKKSI